MQRRALRVAGLRPWWWTPAVATPRPAAWCSSASARFCHGESGKGGHSEGAILPDNIKAQSVMTTATTGKKDMPSFAATLSAQEMKDVAAYVEKLLAR